MLAIEQDPVSPFLPIAAESSELTAFLSLVKNLSESAASEDTYLQLLSALAGVSPSIGEQTADS